MAIGERIRFFRNLKGMTQKYLGIQVGFPEKTADIRMAQYESGSRTPKADLTNNLAEVFGISASALTVPDIDSYNGLMHTLFTLEELSALFNHAIKIYGLRLNPASTVGNMGKEERKEMSYWTVEEYSKFSDEMMDKPISYYAFQMLYWTGIRVGELLALTAGDFDFKNNMLTINKSYQRLHGEDVITTPKTEKSNRTIKMPQFLCDEMQEYLKMFYSPNNSDRIFPISKSYLHHEMDRGSKAAGVKRIRIHDLRHSHVSLLINQGYQAAAIADRVGHETVEITDRYTHIYPSKQNEMANTLDELWKERK